MKKLMFPILMIQLTWLLQGQRCYAQGFTKADLDGWTLFIVGPAPDNHPHGQAKLDTVFIGSTFTLEWDQPMDRQANQEVNSLPFPVSRQIFIPATDATWLTDVPNLNTAATGIATVELSRGLYALQMRTRLKTVSADGTMNGNPESERSLPVWIYVMPRPPGAPSYPASIRIRIEG